MTEAQILSEAMSVLNRCDVGLMCTVDADGMARARWMTCAFGAGGMARLYTLTGKTTRKVEQIRRNPAVTWVFSTPGYGEVVTLLGAARVLESPLMAQSVWDRLVDAARAYSLNGLADDENLEFVTIETQVQRVELLAPRLKVVSPIAATVPARD